jgi:hypothetical protein
MLTIEIYDTNNTLLGTVQSPVVPRIGDSVTYEDGMFTVKTVDFAFENNVLISIRMRIG